MDPGESAGILDCGEISLALKKLFDGLGLQSFVKVSGSKGLHLTVPINSECTYEVTQPFANTVAELLRQQMPERVVTDMSKALRKGKVLIDWSQNSDFKTTVAVYAMRAKREEPFVSLPISWDELKRAVRKKDEQALFFTPEQAIKRVNKLGDLFAPVLTLEQLLPKQFTEAIAAGPKRKLSSWQKHRGKNKDKSLQEYAAKRDHSITPEPPALAPHPENPKGIHNFVIQKHAASHLHYDFRLEMQGVLRSWAVPKGPPLTPKETRMAMHVEDHPLEYADFEGIIPQGQYGGGTVMVWDQGVYGDISGNPTAAFYQGKLHLVMQGEKLKGEWILLKDKREDKDSNKWMLIKAGDPLKISKKADDTSVLTGRTMAQIAKAKDRQWQSNRKMSGSTKKAKKSSNRGSQPQFVVPMLCKAVTELPKEDDWNFEIKFDGYRCLAIKKEDAVQLYSRNHKRLDDQFPLVRTSLESLPGDWILDGEIVALDANGKPSFQLFQNSRSKKLAVCYYVFDLIHLNEENLQNEPIERRREMLGELMRGAQEPIRLSPLLQASVDEVVEAVQQMGLEGVIAKRKGSKYEPGERNGTWLKHRTDQQQEFVVGGYIPGSDGFESLLVGVYEGKQLKYVAKVKNGYVPRLRAELYPRLKKLTVKACPFVNLPEDKGSRWREPLTAEKMQECRWVKPSLVCQVSFVQWTNSDHLRHCSFVGMRDDKKANDIMRET